jgi:hypothetical protein
MSTYAIYRLGSDERPILRDLVPSESIARAVVRVLLRAGVLAWFEALPVEQYAH